MLNILDIDDLVRVADQRTDEWLKDAEDRFMQPYTDTALAAQVTSMVSQVDPETGEKVRKAFGGENYGKS